MLKTFIAAFAIAGAAIPAIARAAESATLDIRGMDCATCPLTVKVVLKRQPGVDDVKVDAEKHTE
jgi:mercuric ion binding protein